MTTVDDVINSVDASALMVRPLPEWRPVLARECQVYVFGETYLAKRFDQINYKFCEKLEAKEILIDNLYALLRYKYFKKSTEEIDDKITRIVNSFTANLKTTLKKVSFDDSADCEVMHQLPDCCVAFRNGVYDFLKNKWFFKYDVVSLQSISNKIYLYRDDYAIMWYFDYDFEPLPIDISTTTLEEFVNFMREITKLPETRNYCFELMYNIAHDEEHKFSMSKFLHLCEILGYTILQSFSQYFCMLIGSGQNGKNSLFDGCFTHRVIPRPAANDLDSIENDRFITGALENKAHNIFLETSAKTYTESKMIKALTGSMYQTIESKGISKYSGVINCKYIFAGNDQNKIKFSDVTNGFRRRINMLEIFYQWDSSKSFLRKGDYYDTTFSDSLHELKSDVTNTTAYVYFAMYGILQATANFTRNFKFDMNDWDFKYTDVNLELKDKLEQISIKNIVSYLTDTHVSDEEKRAMIFDTNKTRLYDSKDMHVYAVNKLEDLLMFFRDDEAVASYFSEHDVYISLRALQMIIRDLNAPSDFTQAFKKLFMLTKLESCYLNKPYAKCTFVNRKLKIVR